MTAKKKNPRSSELNLEIYEPADEIEIVPVVGEFCTENKEFANHLETIRDKITLYISRHQSKKAMRPYNILLSAPPGMGKSFLASQLSQDAARSAGGDVEFDEVFVASMNKVSDIDDVFRRSQSLFLDGKMPVVLFDEVDSKVENINIYNRFLSPMWDGNFFVGTQKFALPPCVFFFAGSTISTEDISSEAVVDLQGDYSYQKYRANWERLFKKQFAHEAAEPELKPEKLRDFIDRVDDIIRIPPIEGMMSEESVLLEYRKTACILIQKHFSKNLDKIHTRVIDSLAKTIRHESLRTAEKAIFSSSPKADQFDFEALPEDYKRQLGVSEDDYNPKDGKELVRVVRKSRHKE